MKKNFFKKLSFVIALAMIVSTIAPAAGAFAATKAPKLSSAKEYLFLGTDNDSSYNFNVAYKQAGWTYAWKSSKTSVATVNKSGVVTAKAIGTTTVSVTIKKGTKLIATPKATVIVKDNIADVKIANKPVGDKLKVNKENDFNRTYTTVSGSTTATTSVVRWTVKEEGATISDKGLFVATKAGKFTITANAFQSTAKYDLWKSDNAKYASYVLDSDTYEVTVVPSMLEAKQTTLTKATVTFDSDMSKELTKDNLKLYSVVNGTRVAQLVKGVAVKDDTDGKVFTVETYVPFESEGSYVFAYGEMEAGFVAAKVAASEVARVELAQTTMEYVNSPLDVDVKLFNAAGVDITTSDLQNRVTYTLDSDEGYMSGDDLYLFAKGQKATITATFHTYEYNPTTYEENVVKGSGVITAVDETTYTFGSTVEWTLAKGAADWDNIMHTLAATDAGYSIFTRIKLTDDTNYAYNHDGNVNDDDSKYSFTSSDDSVLYVSASGDVYPVKAGNAVIICSYDGKPIATLPVVVQSERKVATMTADKTVLTLSNDSEVADTDTIELTVKDQLNENYPIDGDDIAIEALTTNPDTTGPITQAYVAADKTISVDPRLCDTEGAYRYLVKGFDKTLLITVNVQIPDSQTHAFYKLVLGATSVDLAKADDAILENISVNLYDYASDGVKIDKAGWNGDFHYTITKGTDSITTPTLLDGNIEVVADAAAPVAVTGAGATVTVATGNAVSALATGSYLVTVYDAGNHVVQTAKFAVVDTTVAPTYVLENASVTVGASMATVLDAVRNCVKVSLGSTEIADGYLYNVTYIVGNTQYTDSNNSNDLTTAKAAGKVFIKSVKFTKTYSDNGHDYAVEYTVDINRTITVK